MIINIENEKGLNANLNFEDLWSTFDSYLVKKYCDFFKDYEMMSKLQAFEKILSDSSLLKVEHHNFFYRNSAVAYAEKETLSYPVHAFVKKIVNPYNSGHSYHFFDENYLKSDPDFDENKKTYGFIAFGNFIGATSTMDFDYIYQGSWDGIGITALEDFLNNKEARALYEELMAFLTNRKDVAKTNLKNYSKLISKKANLNIFEYDPLSRLVTSDAYLIYHPGCNGYLNDKGSFTPLSGARLFESAVQAERTATSRRIKDSVVIVESKISLTAITNQIPIPSSGTGDLGQGIADLEKKTIMDNLNKVTMEDLEKQIEVLKPKIKDQKDDSSEENKNEIENIPEEPVVSKRRRM